MSASVEGGREDSTLGEEMRDLLEGEVQGRASRLQDYEDSQQHGFYLPLAQPRILYHAKARPWTIASRSRGTAATSTSSGHRKASPLTLIAPA